MLKKKGVVVSRMEATKNILICALVIVWSVFLLMMYKKRFDTRYKLEFIPVRYESDPKMLVCDGGLWISSRLTPNSLKEWMALIWPLSFHEKLTVAGARIRGTASLFSRLLSKSRCDAVVELKMEKGTQYGFLYYTPPEDRIFVRTKGYKLPLPEMYQCEETHWQKIKPGQCLVAIFPDKKPCLYRVVKIK